MKKMSNKKKKDILETAMGLWTGICFGGWLCNAIECKDAEATVFVVAWITVPAVILFISGFTVSFWHSRKKNKAKKQAEKFIENWAKFKIEEDKAS